MPEFGWAKRLLWRLLWYPARLVGALVFNLDLRKEAPIPRGPLVVAPNHFAHPDPPFVGLGVKRPMRFLALDELWGNVPMMDRVFRLLGAIPLPRTRYPVSAMRAALAHLESGGAVGVFPEGRRVTFWGEEEPRKGAAWLALRTGAQIVPVAVWGTQDTMPLGTLTLRPAKVWVRVGAPINSDDFLDYEDPLTAIMGAWQTWIGTQLTEMAEASPRKTEPGTS